MILNISKLTLSRMLREKLQTGSFKNDAFILELANNFHKVKNARIWWTEDYPLEPSYDKFDSSKITGLANVTFEVEYENKYFLIKGKISHSFVDNVAEIFAFSVRALERSQLNGMVCQVVAGQISPNTTTDMVRSIIAIKDASKLTIEDNSDILSALQLYNKVLSDKEKTETLSISFKDMSSQMVLILSPAIRNEFPQLVKDKIIQKFKDKYIALENDIQYIKNSVEFQQYIENQSLMITFESKHSFRKQITPTLKDILSLRGELYTSKNSRISLTDNLGKMKLYQFSFSEYEQKHYLDLLVEIPRGKELEDYSNEYLHIANIPNMVKNKTILSVIKKIEQKNIPNNEVFQFLFNEAEYRPSVIPGWSIDFNLVSLATESLKGNVNQIKAFDLCVDSNPLSFVQGPPGTGKTHLICALVKYYTSMNKKVLISSQTNVAVENVLKKLWDDKNFMGIPIKVEAGNKSEYSENKVSSLIKEKLESKLGWDLEGMSEYSINEVQAAKDFKIVGSTTTSSTLESRKWADWSKDIDVLIVDEISKSSVPELIRYTMIAKKVIYIGDQKQLPPLDEIPREELEDEDKFSVSERAIIRKYILANIFASKYAEMAKNGRAIMLNNNFRSLPVIANLYSMFYNDALVPMRSNESSIKFIGKTEFKPFNFFAVNNAKEAVNEKQSRYNLMEIEAIKNTIVKLKEELDDPSKYTIAVISQYGAQVGEIVKAGVRELLKAKNSRGQSGFKRIKIDTIDAFQGDEADIVILSTVLADKSKTTGFFDDYRRINVAVSRARDMLLMFGNDFILGSVSSKIDNELPQQYLGRMLKVARENPDAKFKILKGGE